MKTLLICGLLLAGITGDASADTVRVMCAGNVTCSEWTDLRASTAYFSAGNWILGFLSSTAWNTGDDLLKGKKTDDLFNAVDHFCLSKPKETISDAAAELAYHLIDKSQP